MVTERVKIMVTAGVCAAVAAVLFVLDPTRVGIFPPCLLHEYTGWWCPGCGSTRALHQLLHGQLATAFRLNPLAVSLLPLIGYWVVRRGRVPMKPVWIWTLLVVIVCFGILRNVPVYPLTLLAP